MSVAIVIVPVLVGGWPVFGTLASLAASKMGFKLIKTAQRKEKKEIDEREIEIVDEKSKILEESIKEEEELVFNREDISLIIKKDIHKKFVICVKGKNKKEEELERIGKSFLKEIKKQYAYKKIKEEVTKKGFTVIEEKKEGNNIRLILRKF